jgi:hypothetical protein
MWSKDNPEPVPALLELRVYWGEGPGLKQIIITINVKL